MKSRIAVIVPAYNEELLIEKTINSIPAQSGNNNENTAGNNNEQPVVEEPAQTGNNNNKNTERSTN